jgi:hypothetical protein
MDQHRDKQEKFDPENNHIGPAEMSAGDMAAQDQINDARDHQQRDADPRDTLEGEPALIQCAQGGGWFEIVHCRTEGRQKETDTAKPQRQRDEMEQQTESVPIVHEKLRVERRLVLNTCENPLQISGIDA